MAGMARWTSHSSGRAGKGRRVALGRGHRHPDNARPELASSSAGASRPSGRANAADRFVHPGQRGHLPLRGARLPVVQLLPGGPGRLPAPVRAAPALGLAGLQRGRPGPWPTASAGTAPGRTAGGTPPPCGATSGVICARREEKASMTSWSTPPTSNPLPSARGHQDIAQVSQPRGQLPRGVARPRPGAPGTAWPRAASASGRPPRPPAGQGS